MRVQAWISSSPRAATSVLWERFGGTWVNVERVRRCRAYCDERQALRAVRAIMVGICANHRSYSVHSASGRRSCGRLGGSRTPDSLWRIGLSSVVETLRLTTSGHGPLMAV